MKVAYKHLISYIPSKPTINEISDRFFQLGHEHEIEDEIFNMELTPNRGDCLSVFGLVRDLAPFYEIELTDSIYEERLKKLDINFINHAPVACSHISFLKIDIEGEITPYKGKLKEYFKDLRINTNNFFTDISNFISYERGQPTHCYDAKKIGDFSLEFVEEEKKFHTLLAKEIILKGKNLVFLQDEKVINLAGVMGGLNTSCSINTKSVIIECAHFNPEYILGKSVKYDIKSDAAHKFERGVDPLCHEKVLRRFIKIVSDHANIKNIELYSDTSIDYNFIKIPFDPKKISNILGISYNQGVFEECLLKLGFKIQDNKIIVPSYRNDIKNLNDLAEEIARVIGYDNISAKSFQMPSVNAISEIKILEQNIKDFLINNGFFEVINNPFINSEEDYAIKVDNPLDSNRQYIRTNLEKSLIENLLYNERRQQDSIKLFEISDVYSIDDSNLKNKKVLGIICSGRVGKNYLDFSKKITIKHIRNLMKVLLPKTNIIPINIDRKNLDTKISNEIVYLELELNSLKDLNLDVIKNQKKYSKDHNFIKYIPVSEFPSSSRDLSFSIKNIEKYYEIQEYLLTYKNNLIKEVFIFDFYNNHKNNEIKIGFRFVFQSHEATITDNEINNIMKVIMAYTNSIEGVTIPGIDKENFK